MKSMAMRVVTVVVAVAVLVGAGYQVWKLDDQVRAGRAAIVAFESQIRQASHSLAAIRATQRAYVAEGQSTVRWQTQLTGLVQAVGPALTDLRMAAKTPEGQGALESAVETMAAFGQADTKARDYISSGQRLSASDVVFADGNDLLVKAESALETARGQERAKQDTTTDALRQRQLIFLGVAVGLTILALLALVPIPKPGGDALAAERVAAGSSGGAGLGLSQSSDAAGGIPGGPGAPLGPQDLGTAAEVCAAMARVRDPLELPALLERAAKALDASGLIVWMSEGTPVMLRPVLAHGYPPATLARLGSIGPDADNATAVAFRTRSVQTLSGELLSGGAIVAPLITAEGCTGAMAIELNKDVEPSDYLRAVSTILAAQLATLITPAPLVDVPPPGR